MFYGGVHILYYVHTSKNLPLVGVVKVAQESIYTPFGDIGIDRNWDESTWRFLSTAPNLLSGPGGLGKGCEKYHELHRLDMF